MSLFVDSLVLGACYALLAIPMVAYFKFSKYFNFAILSYCYLCPPLTIYLDRKLKVPFPFLISVILIGLIVFSVEYFLIRPLGPSRPAEKILTSLGVFFLIFCFTSALTSQVSSSGKNLSFMRYSIEIAGINVIPIIVFIVLSTVSLSLHYKTVLGKKIRAYTYDEQIAASYGVSQLWATIIMSGLVALFTCTASILLSDRKSEFGHFGVVAIFALLAISAVIPARYKNMALAVILSFVIASIQLLAVDHLPRINNVLNNACSALGFETSIKLSIGFATVFVPFLLSLLFLWVLPKKLVGDKDV